MLGNSIADGFTETKKKDIYVDWFETKEAAEEHIREAKNA